MGLTNPDVMVMKSGAELSNCYMTFVSGPAMFPFPFQPPPLTLSWTINTDGNKHYFANGTLFTYLNKASKTSGMAPLQTQEVSIPADDSAAGVFSVFYAALHSQYTNGVVDD